MQEPEALREVHAWRGRVQESWEGKSEEQLQAHLAARAAEFEARIAAWRATNSHQPPRQLGNDK